MLLDDGSDEPSVLCLLHFFFLLRFFFFYEESDDDGSRFGSYGTCSFSFFSENSVGCVSGSKSVFRVSGLFYVGRVSEILSVN